MRCALASALLMLCSSVRSLDGTLSVSAIGSIVSNRPFSSAIISDTHVYKCGQSGLWSDAQLVQYQRFHFSDNRYGIGFTGVGLLFENSVIVGAPATCFAEFRVINISHPHL